MKQRFGWLLIGLAATACAGTAGRADPGLVPVTGEHIRVELRYFSGENLVGERLDGYRANRCLLVPAAREALQKVAADLAARGLGLVTFDCYRPQRAVDHFVRWAGQPENFSTKAAFYPREEKARLFEHGYIAARSGHSRGATVDLGLYRLNDGGLVNMGTSFDFMDARSATDFALADREAHDNRMLLRDTMTARGFHNYPQEWWHYTFKPEPWPDHYFDVPVQ
ncbi:M15 family metallopeptidase [Microbulbifer hainanensis]|uniref:M15 family metallopeptidase n=1 Tax=Microbulbifer hainanensis TaxID=2735675 RepID=UPI0018685AB6|nr:M15 family metallopeptidase [Microbulbifer hainanensis]